MKGFPDWHLASDYEALRTADHSLLAWEWLRRTPAYRQAFFERPATAGDHAAARRFGLQCFENPERGVPNARPMWRAEVDPFIIKASGRVADPDEDTVDLDMFGPMCTTIRGTTFNHLLISDGVAQLRLDLHQSCPLKGAVRLDYVVTGITAMERSLRALGRWLSLVANGRFERRADRSGSPRQRQMTILRAFDGMASGATQRELAAVLVDADAARLAWRHDLPSVRSRVQRLARSSRSMAAGGFQSLLRRGQ